VTTAAGVSVQETSAGVASCARTAGAGAAARFGRGPRRWAPAAARGHLRGRAVRGRSTSARVPEVMAGRPSYPGVHTRKSLIVYR